MKRRSALFAAIFAVGALAIGTIACDEAADVAHDEFGPRAALKKYEWFKDAAAALDAKVADIRVYEAKQKDLTDMYAGKPRSEWPRDDREAYSINASELAGMKTSFNKLAADYNAQMAKFNWAFAEAGRLPAGASTPLPREFKSYVEN